jgi:hypothetical protein
MDINKEVLLKGVKYLSIAALLLFLGPIMLNSTFKNEESPYYIVALILSISVCIFAVFMGFKGVKTIVSSMFDNK